MGNGVEDYKGTGHLTQLQLYTGVDPVVLLIKRLDGAKIAIYFQPFLRTCILVMAAVAQRQSQRLMWQVCLF